MSYSKCFICGRENYSGNETKITVERNTLDKEKLIHRVEVWAGHVCEGCLNKHLAMLDVEVGE